MGEITISTGLPTGIIKVLETKIGLAQLTMELGAKLEATGHLASGCVDLSLTGSFSLTGKIGILGGKVVGL